MNRQSLPRRVEQILRDYGLSPGDTIIVALSGGADSCALLDILTGLKDLSLRLIVAHLNHCLRGAESDADEKFCRNRAHHHGLLFESGRIDVGEIARTEGINLEDAGRQARHRFLEGIRKQYGAAAIALAHHADDQAETVLMRLLRGSGSTGLSGMSFRNGTVIRPLLHSTRLEIENYLAELQLCHREDLSNGDVTFLRNRIRHELLPLLETYNPSIRTTLTTTASLLSDDDTVLGDLAAELASKACRFTAESVICDLTILLHEPAALQRRLFRHALEQLHGNLKHFGFRHLQAIEKLIHSPRPNASLDLPMGTRARRSYDRLYLERFPSEPQDLIHEGVITIAAPGVYHFPWGGSLTLSQQTDLPGAANFTSNTAWFDLERVPFPWRARTFRDGDRMTPLGMTGTKKVKDIFIDAKVPRSQRAKITLIFSTLNLIWACGLRTSCHSQINTPSSSIIKGEYSET